MEDDLLKKAETNLINRNEEKIIRFLEGRILERNSLQKRLQKTLDEIDDILKLPCDVAVEKYCNYETFERRQ